MLNCIILKYTKSVINMGTRVNNNMPGFIKEVDDYKAFEKELKIFFFCCSFNLVEEFVSS